MDHETAISAHSNTLTGGISNMSIYQPYTYLIGWTHHNKWYYGVRYARNCNPQDLWKTYFTSSNYVKKFREEYGEPDVIQIRKIFDNKHRAFLWEQKVLRRLNVPFNIKMLNKNIGGSFIKTKNNNFITNNPMKNEFSRHKMSETRKNKELGKKSAKYLMPLYGDCNPMRNPQIVERMRKKITGRKREYRDDGSWFWSYSKNEGIVCLTKDNPKP